MLAMVAAADSAKVQKKSTAFLYIAKQNHTLCTLFINRCANCVFYSIWYVRDNHLNVHFSIEGWLKVQLVLPKTVLRFER